MDKSHLPDDSIILEWFSENFYLIDAVFLSFFIAAVRIFYVGGPRRIAFLEAVFCALITAGAFPFIMYFSLPHSMAATIGALIGTLGVRKIVSLANTITEMKFPTRKK